MSNVKVAGCGWLHRWNDVVLASQPFKCGGHPVGIPLISLNKIKLIWRWSYFIFWPRVQQKFHLFYWPQKKNRTEVASFVFTFHAPFSLNWILDKTDLKSNSIELSWIRLTSQIKDTNIHFSSRYNLVVDYWVQENGRLFLVTSLTSFLTLDSNRQLHSNTEWEYNPSKLHHQYNLIKKMKAFALI